MSPHYEHVVLLGARDELVAHVVHDPVLELHVRELLHTVGQRVSLLLVHVGPGVLESQSKATRVASSARWTA
jgi:hypothetical protein